MYNALLSSFSGVDLNSEHMLQYTNFTYKTPPLLSLSGKARFQMSLYIYIYVVCAVAPEISAPKGFLFFDFLHLCGHMASPLGGRSVHPKASAYTGGETQ